MEITAPCGSWKVKAADVRDVGQGHDSFGTEFLRLAGRGVDIVHGNIGAPLWRAASSCGGQAMMPPMPVPPVYTVYDMPGTSSVVHPNSSV
jgi:hypothetical protein